MNPQEKVFEMMNALNIEYQIINHPAGFGKRTEFPVHTTQNIANNPTSL